ncbi:hypothetical protein NDU88_001529 [Pleurodeles waltl]|uniref:Uncharacterized protein n=1 Tax=Pleurodeles waltl TaxID=8319 RepID=A0AAV7VWP4_PLEWA|nr:hypothetical protein NDU88_001529 [Pleurodeles waltl]
MEDEVRQRRPTVPDVQMRHALRGVLGEQAGTYYWCLRRRNLAEVEGGALQLSDASQETAVKDQCQVSGGAWQECGTMCPGAWQRSGRTTKEVRGLGGEWL